jgi:colanic acid/amylovoran biosynthesis glycosyltransferase
MRLAIIVTEFPKTTETFILRDLVEFHKRGHEVRIYHMTSFRRGEVVHGFARQTLDWARSSPYFFGTKVLGAVLRAKFGRPGVFIKTLGTVFRAYWREPVWLAKTLFIVPKCLVFAEEMKEWGADHVHAEFATHPATCAWIAGRFAGLPYSVSCRAHDIFLTRSLLSQKLNEAAKRKASSSDSLQRSRRVHPGPSHAGPRPV